MKIRRWLLALCAFGMLRMVWTGCGEDEPERRGDFQPLNGWGGPPPRLTFDVMGPEADNDKREKCAKIASGAGIVLDPTAPVRVILTLRDEANRLQVFSTQRGAMLRDEPRPGWNTERLCQDAIMAGVSALRQEFAGAPPPGYPPPPPGYPPSYGQPPPPPYYAPPVGGPARLAIEVTGPEADNDKREKCQKMMSNRGLVSDPSSPVRVILMLRDNGNQLQVISTRRNAMLRNEPRPGWSMDKLCEDAIAAGLAALSQESGPPPGAPPPPPPMQLPMAPHGPAQTAAPGLVPLQSGASRNVSELAIRGTRAYAKGDYASALAAFAEASRSSQDPALLFDTGLCYHMLNRGREAQQYMQLYLDRAPNAANRAQVEALVHQLQQSEDAE